MIRSSSGVPVRSIPASPGLLTNSCQDEDDGASGGFSEQVPSLASERSTDDQCLAGPQRLQYEPFIIAVAGGTASGKTTVCNLIIQRLHDQCVAVISQDSFYKPLSSAERSAAAIGDYNFDAPSAIDEAALLASVDTLRRGEAAEIPVYDFATHARSATATRRVEPAQVIVIEGILALHFPSILARANLKVFVDSDDDVRLARRIRRDVAERGRDVEGVIAQYTRFVKPSHDRFIAPSRRRADIIVPWQKGDNFVAVDMIVGHLSSHIVADVLLSRFPTLHLIASTFQMRGMHTIIRNRETAKGEFIFMADRLIRLVVEYALGLLPTRPAAVRTPTGTEYRGVRLDASVCGVSVIRSGEAMESALRSCWKGIDIGKILVYRRHRPPMHRGVASSAPGGGADSSCPPAAAAAPPPQDDGNGTFYRGVPLSQDGGTMGRGGDAAPAGDGWQARPGASSLRRVSIDAREDDLVYEKLPHDIAERHVLLLDPILGTGYTASRAFQVLVEKGVQEDAIYFLTLIASREGISRICRRFPRAKVITTAIDDGLDGNFRVKPGIGEFGDRYFCA